MGGTISGDFETIICLYIPREINSKNKNNCKTTTTTLTVFSNHNLVVVLSVVIIRQLYEYYKKKQVSNYVELLGAGIFSVEQRSYRYKTDNF